MISPLVMTPLHVTLTKVKGQVETFLFHIVHEDSLLRLTETLQQVNRMAAFTEAELQETHDLLFTQLFTKCPLYLTSFLAFFCSFFH